MHHLLIWVKFIYAYIIGVQRHRAPSTTTTDDDDDDDSISLLWMDWKRTGRIIILVYFCCLVFICNFCFICTEFSVWLNICSWVELSWNWLNSNFSNNHIDMSYMRYMSNYLFLLCFMCVCLYEDLKKKWSEDNTSHAFGFFFSFSWWFVNRGVAT